ncbi:MAG: PKD domain-containing protein [Burkholderiaceae bacterium]
MRTRHILSAAFTCMAVSVLSSCGGGSGSAASGGSGNDDANASALTGVLVDSPVAGIGYRTATRSGTTDANGLYRYLPGETVTFFVGDVTLPPVPATGTVTPFTLADSSDSNDRIALNIATFLQSLDADANPANGISIPSAAAALANGGIDFNVPVTTFEQNANLIALVRDANPGGRTPVDADTARAHLLQTLSGLANPPNLAPIAVANGSASAIQTGQSITFSGTQSSDPNGDDLSFQWTLSAKPQGSQVVLSGSDANQVTFTADVAGTYTVSLVVGDGSLQSIAATGHVVVTNPPPAPQATLTGLSIGQAPTKMAVGGSHALVATATYSDNSTVDVTAQASWSSTAPSVLAVNATTGQLSALAAGTAQIGASFAGASASAVAVDVITLPAPAVHVPVSTADSGSGNGTATLRWNPVTDAAGYKIYWVLDGQGVTAASNAIENVQSGHVQTSLASGRYAYRVAAMLGDVEALSEEVFTYVYGAGQPSGVFASASAPPSANIESVAIGLPDGKVLMVGSFMDDSVPADVYDPATDSYTQVASPTGRLWAASTLTPLPQDKVLIAGGYVGGGVATITNETFIYDSQTNSTVAGPNLPYTLMQHTATPLPDGRVLVAGGLANNAVTAQTLIFDPATQSFTSGPAMAVARRWHAAIALQDGRVLILGGVGQGGSLASTEIYDSQSNTFGTGPTMAHAGSGSASVLLADGRILVAGGYENASSVRTAQIFDPQTAQFTSTGQLNAPRDGGTAALLPDGRVLLAGGYDGSNYTANAEVYDPASGQFAVTGSRSQATISYASMVRLRDGRVLMLRDDVVDLYGP